MKAGDVSGGRSSSRETWLSAPLSDPNAALWASISPPANRDIPTVVRRRAAAFSLDLLAHRLHLRLPAYFSSRASARTGILGAAMVFGASVGVIGFLALGAWQQDVSDESELREASSIETLQPAPARAAAPPAQPTVSAGLARQGRALNDVAAPSTTVEAASTATTAIPPTFAATALPMAAEPTSLSRSQQRRARIEERRSAARAKAKARRMASAKSKATARRTAKARRTRAMTD
jgi:hypothetical protein